MCTFIARKSTSAVPSVVWEMSGVVFMLNSSSMARSSRDAHLYSVAATRDGQVSLNLLPPYFHQLLRSKVSLQERHFRDVDSGSHAELLLESILWCLAKGDVCCNFGWDLIAVLLMASLRFVLTCVLVAFGPLYVGHGRLSLPLSERWQISKQLCVFSVSHVISCL